MSVTCLEQLLRVDRFRIKTGKWASENIDGFNGCFLVPLAGEQYFVVLSDADGFRHLACTNAQKKEIPNWQIMRQMKEMFFADDAWVVQYYGPKNERLVDPYTLHLWESIDEPMPHPKVVEL